MHTEWRIIKPILVATLVAVVAVTLLASAGYLPVAGAETGASTVKQSGVQTNQGRGDSEKAHWEQAWKTGLVEGAFLFNRQLHGFSIDVEVEGDRATLNGAVETETEKDLAEQIALSIEGIDEVINNLAVHPEADNQPARADDGAGVTQTISDAAITAKIKSRLLANGEVKGLAINVDTDGGYVKLAGTARSEAERELAYYLARNTGGVVDVENHIKVPTHRQTQ